MPLTADDIRAIQKHLLADVLVRRKNSRGVIAWQEVDSEDDELNYVGFIPLCAGRRAEIERIGKHAVCAARAEGDSEGDWVCIEMKGIPGYYENVTPRV